MNILIADSETNGFLSKPDLKLHMIQLGDADSDDCTIYGDFDPALGIAAGLKNPVRPMAEGVARMQAADKIVWQNGIGFDWEVCERFLPGAMRRDQMLDTLVMARLAFPTTRDHSLRGWGARLGVPKDTYAGNYSTVDTELLTYSEQDIHAGRALFNHVKHVMTWGSSCDLEHEVQWALIAQERNGFRLDVKAAEDLCIDLRVQQAALEAQFQTAFPPLIRQTFIIPKVNNKTRGYVKGERCLAKEWLEPFNPASRQHIAERLVLAGWKPTEFGAAGDPTVDEETLARLPYPEAKLLTEHAKVSKILGAISDGKSGYLRLVDKDDRLHGRVNGCGARTRRMSHSKPNSANVGKKGGERKLFIPRAGWKLVGCDGEGIQLRVVSHYLWPYDGGQLAERIVKGRKEDGTDAHSMNWKALEHLVVKPPVDRLAAREGAKTTVYAKMFGSTAAGLAYTFKDACAEAGVNPVKMGHYKLGDAVNRALSVGMYGLDKLEKKAGELVDKQGYITGLDGGLIYCNQARLALVTLCQGGEAVIMKLALALFMRKHGHLHGTYFGLCANVHDEVQFEAHPDYADMLGKSFADCITQAGLDLGVRCHMAGKHIVGNSWQETH